MIVLEFILIFIILFFSTITFACYMTHVGMVKDYSKSYGRASFKTYLKEFSKYNWNNEYESLFEGSLWDRENNCELHADIVKFNGVGMIMKTPWDYWMMKYHLHQYCKSLNAKELHYQWE